MAYCLCPVCPNHGTRSTECSGSCGDHDAASGGVDCTGKLSVGADWNLGGTAAACHADRAAHCAVSCGVSRQSVIPNGGIWHRKLALESGCMVESADDPRHAVVHPVQCHCRRSGDAE